MQSGLSCSKCGFVGGHSSHGGWRRRRGKALTFIRSSRKSSGAHFRVCLGSFIRRSGVRSRPPFSFRYERYLLSQRLSAAGQRQGLPQVALFPAQQGSRRAVLPVHRRGLFPCLSAVLVFLRAVIAERASQPAASGAGSQGSRAGHPA
jgi:hypothetical protein